ARRVFDMEAALAHSFLSAFLIGVTLVLVVITGAFLLDWHREPSVASFVGLGLAALALVAACAYHFLVLPVLWLHRVRPEKQLRWTMWEALGTELVLGVGVFICCAL